MNLLRLFSGLAGILLVATGCRDDLGWQGKDSVEPGLPAVVSLSFETAEPDIKTRAAIPEERARRLNSLWLGFFDKETGNLTHRFLYPEIQNTLKTDPDQPADSKPLTVKAQITSGEYFICAVANPSGNFGVMAPDDYGNRAVAVDTEIVDFLMSQEMVSTLDDLKRIAHVNGDRECAQTLSLAGNLCMFGVYVPQGQEHPHSPADVNNYLEQSVTIDEVGTVDKPVELPGCIHLRRMMSHVTFNVNFGPAIHEAEITEVRFINVPTVSWIAERKETDRMVNAGDMATIRYADGTTQKNYPEGPEIFSKDITKLPLTPEQSSDGVSVRTHSFDWYQMAVRRRGNINTGIVDDTEELYRLREEEHKSALGLNTSVYKALCPEFTVGDEVPVENLATYVQMKVRMKVAYPELSDEDKYQLMITGDDKNDVYVDAIYTVHLGFVKNADGVADPNDFSCERNCDYTYNITVNGVSKIIVEALRKEADYQHGAEGVVTFTDGEVFEADAHYCVYNICLTDQERLGLSDAEVEAGVMPDGNKSLRGWKMRVYKSATEALDIHPEDIAEGSLKNIDERYWDWVEFRATTGPGKLAVYKPTSGANADGKTFNLREFSDIENFPGQRTDSDDENDNVRKMKIGRWYTVFINEYVYRSGRDTDVDFNEDWGEFVNLPPRMIWFHVSEKNSTDYESKAINARYAIRQKSIQTHFSSLDATGYAAIGLEHENETYGAPLFNAFGGGNTSYSDELNPRYLMIDYLDRSYGNHSGRSVNNTNKRKWDTYTRMEYPFLTDHRSRTETGEESLIVERMKTYRQTGVGRPFEPNNRFNANNGHRFTECLPAREICMNRNRDLNGDGVIQDDEIRWFIPNDHQYIAFALGAHGLQNPLFDFSEQTPGGQLRVYVPVHATGSGDKATEIVLSNEGWENNTGETDWYHKGFTHYYTMGRRQVWGEEGISVNDIVSGHVWPMNVRCARYLGSYHKTPTQTAPELPMYMLKQKGDRKFVKFNLIPEALRTPVYSSFLEPHRIHERINAAPQSRYIEFKYGSDDIRINGENPLVGTVNTLTWGNYLNLGDNICKRMFGTGWRMPNQVEMEAIRAVANDGFPFIGENAYFLTCSREFFSDSRWMAAYANHSLAWNTDCNNKPAWLRCVRDAKPSEVE